MASKAHLNAAFFANLQKKPPSKKLFVSFSFSQAAEGRSAREETVAHVLISVLQGIRLKVVGVTGLRRWGKLGTRQQKLEWERAGEREGGRSMLRHYKTKVLGGPHTSPKQIFTCSSILASLSAESTPMGGYLSKVFSRVVT